MAASPWGRAEVGGGCLWLAGLWQQLARGPCLPVNWALRTCGLWMMSFQSCSNSGILATFCSSRTRSRPIMKQSMNWGKGRKKLLQRSPAAERGAGGRREKALGGRRRGREEQSVLQPEQMIHSLHSIHAAAPGSLPRF